MAWIVARDATHPLGQQVGYQTKSRRVEIAKRAPKALPKVRETSPMPFGEPDDSN